MSKPTELLIQKVRRLTCIDNVDGSVLYTGGQIENAQVEFTGDKREKLDAEGVPIAQFDTAKGVTLSGEMTLLSTYLLSNQLGADVQVASATNKIHTETFEVLPVKDKKATMTYTPSTLPQKVYVFESGNIGEAILVGADADNASISEKEITLPDSVKATQVGVYYEYDSETASMIDDSSEGYSDTMKYILDVLCADPCNQAIKVAARLIIPKGKMDNNVSINMATDGTHPFSITAMKDYCSTGSSLCYWIFE